MALRKILEANPHLWKLGGDLSLIARRHFQSSVNLSDGLKETTRIGLQEMEKELGYETASPLEKLLISQIITCWLCHSIIEFQYAGITKRNATIELGDFWERQVSSSQRRYLRAIETLARVRKLIRPDPNPVQFNFAEKQVNIAGAIGTIEKP